MVSQASSQKAMITSCALRLMRPVARQEAGLGELLGDRAAALADAAAAHVGDHRPADPARVDPPVAVEAPVLDRDEGGRRQRVELGDVDRRFLDRAAPGDRLAVVADSSSSAGSSSGSSARDKGAVTTSHSKVTSSRPATRIEHQRPAPALRRRRLLGARPAARRRSRRERVGQLLDRHVRRGSRFRRSSATLIFSRTRPTALLQ